MHSVMSEARLCISWLGIVTIASNRRPTCYYIEADIDIYVATAGYQLSPVFASQLLCRCAAQMTLTYLYILILKLASLPKFASANQQE